MLILGGQKFAADDHKKPERAALYHHFANEVKSKYGSPLFYTPDNKLSIS